MVIDPARGCYADMFICAGEVRWDQGGEKFLDLYAARRAYAAAPDDEAKTLVLADCLKAGMAGVLDPAQKGRIGSLLAGLDGTGGTGGSVSVSAFGGYGGGKRGLGGTRR